MDGANSVNYILQNNIEGAFVECGVCEGDIQEIWINTLEKNNYAIRDIYLYDTFAGLVEPGEYDYTCKGIKTYNWKNWSRDEAHKYWRENIINDKVNNWCYAPLEKVKQRLNMTGYPENNLHYVVGDVMETLKDKTTIPEKIAILRLDTDWYESSKYELEQMYDNVVTGGLIIFDDYYYWDGQRRATDEFFLSRNIIYEFLDVGNCKTATIIKK
jgi:hypothetical protein